MNAPAAKKPKLVIVKKKKKGAPAYMVSFGDMMTLILCFFILLVSLAKERDYGLMARGIGSFVMSVRTMGLTGVLSGTEKQRIFDEVRRRFNLPPEPDPERRPAHEEASPEELTRAEVVDALSPRRERSVAQIAVFSEGSAEPLSASLDYLAELAEILRPRKDEVLVLEGHAMESGVAQRGLAQRRAEIIKQILCSDHGFNAERIEVRAWYAEPVLQGKQTRAVDARVLLAPTTDPKQ